MRLKRKSELLIILIAAALIQSCNTTGCLENQNSLPLAGFYSSSSGQAISIDSVDIGGIGAPGDSLLNVATKLSTIYLPFRSSKPSTSFYFRYRQHQFAAAGVEDTITFNYTAEPRFVSEDCGAMYFYRITDIKHTSWLIDSISVTDSLITNADIERIHIFFRTSEDPDLL